MRGLERALAAAAVGLLLAAGPVSAQTVTRIAMDVMVSHISNRPGDVSYGSSGIPVPGYEARLVGEDGESIGEGDIGELVVRGPSAGEGYWNQREKSRKTFAGEWTYTGDKYRREADEIA